MACIVTLTLDDALEKGRKDNRIQKSMVNHHIRPPLGDSLSAESDTLRGERTVNFVDAFAHALPRDLGPFSSFEDPFCSEFARIALAALHGGLHPTLPM
jgi:hypothetical protein